MDVYNLTIEIIRKKQVNVNNELVYMPYRWPPSNSSSDPKVTISKYGSGGFEIKTDFNVRVEVMDDYRVCVYVPEVPGIVDNTCGLAGFLDGNPNNDFRLPNGTLTSSTTEFGDSWIVPDGTDLNADCLTDAAINNTDCDPDVYLKAQQICGSYLGNKFGAFAPCFVLEEFTTASYKSCSYDECHSNLDNNTLCIALVCRYYQC